MPVAVAPVPQPLSTTLLEALSAVAFPTLGHYLEVGFCDPALRRFVGGGRIVGRARTVRTLPTDSSLLHAAVSRIEPGDVVVVDTGGDRRHAPIGEVVATALSLRGAAGVLVDGVCTDLEELARIGLPVYAFGTSLLTTKLEDTGLGGLDVPVVCGGVTVASGDVVLADVNGVLVAPASQLAAIVATARQDDLEEVGLLQALREGADLGVLTGAAETLLRHAVPGPERP